MYEGQPLGAYPFDASAFLSRYFEVINDRLVYIRQYLKDLGAVSVVEEPQYFDRDYLSEFSAFYGRSARGYPNICARVHVFKSHVDRGTLTKALSGDEGTRTQLEKNYLGYIVIRPVPEARFGRTVLSWYEDLDLKNPRVTNPSRTYECHLAGIPLKVHGLAWQQQDAGVATCATVSIWTLLHSSAFDDHHAIPTTSEITQAANRMSAHGKRVFPSTGLTVEQLGESIKAQGLSPVLVQGEESSIGHGLLPDGSIGFSAARFAATCSAFIRSGYPVLIFGELVENDTCEGSPHAVVAVGFRPATDAHKDLGTFSLQDGDAGCFYLHDDNLGPSVRFELDEDEKGYARLTLKAPKDSSASPDLFKNYGPLYPSVLIAAVHEDLCTDPDDTYRWGVRFAKELMKVAQEADKPFAMSLRTRIIKQYKLLEEEFKFLKDKPEVLSRVRLELFEDIPPMSLHVAQVRIGVGAFPLIDVLFDTTDSQENIFGHIVYSEWAEHLADGSGVALGHRIRGYDQ